MFDVADPAPDTGAGAPPRAQFVLTLSCSNRPGIVAAVATALFEAGADIVEAQQFDDPSSRQFTMRMVFAPIQADAGIARFEAALQPVAARFGLGFALRDLRARQRVLLLVSKFDHCLADLLYRWHIGELPMDVVGIVANHPAETYAHLDFRGVPFHYLPITAATKAAQEARLLALAEQADLVVLARYMQVLSDRVVAALAGRCINIHHSFLPGFKGARPYHQAYERGVKLIGATAHYVTAELDEGPIIEQDVERISHADTPEALIRKGRDIERRVLARALRYHLQSRVLISGHKTIVFAD